jgi:hypothetical protein
MGLLTKAQLMDQQEKEKKEHSEDMAGDLPKGNGLLEKAEKYESTEESESEEGEPKGLLKRAETIHGDSDEKGSLEKPGSFGSDSQDPGEELFPDIDSSDTAYEPKGGLLQQAAMILAGEEEQIPGAEREEIEVRTGIQEGPADEIVLEEGVLTKDMLEGEEEFLLEKAEPAAPVNGGTGEPPTGERGGLLKQAILLRETEKAAKKPDEKVSSKQVEEEATVQEGEPDEKTVEIPPTPVPPLVEQCLTEGYTQRVISLLNDICGQDGYLTLCETVAETMARLGKGKTCMLFLYKRGRYTVEGIYPEDSMDKKTSKVGFGKSSRLIKALESNTGQSVRSVSIKDEAIIKEIKKLDNILPWTAYPLPSADGITGFIIVGGQSKRPRVDNKVTGLFIHLAGIYLSSYVQKRESLKELEKLKVEKAEKETVIDMYNSADRLLGTGRDTVLKEAMSDLYTSLEIESAALVTGWGSPGKLLVEDSIGIPKNILGKYRVSKTDKKIKTVIETREPAVLSDAAKRLTKLSKKNDEQLKTFIVAPVLFCDEMLGILNIHRMKGAGKKLTKNVKSKIQHGTLSIAPFILYNKLMNANPWNILESFLSGETAKSKRTRKPLNLVMFTMENGKKVLDTQGFSRYWGFAEKLHRIIDKNIQEKGVFRVVDWNKTVLSLREIEKSETNAMVKQIKKEFNESFKGTKKERIINITSSATVFPDVSKDMAALLAAIF